MTSNQAVTFGGASRHHNHRVSRQDAYTHVTQVAVKRISTTTICQVEHQRRQSQCYGNKAPMPNRKIDILATLKNVYHQVILISRPAGSGASAAGLTGAGRWDEAGSKNQSHPSV